MVFMFIATALHIVLCLVFVVWFDYGIIGLGLAMTIKDGVLMSLTMMYGSCSSQVRHILAPFDSEAFRGWGQYLKICLPTTAMICSEMWAFEVLLILAGIIGVVELASMTITLAFATLV